MKALFWRGGDGSSPVELVLEQRIGDESSPPLYEKALAVHQLSSE